MSVVDDLKASRAELVKRGRCQKYLYRNDTGEVCMLGAVGMATIEGFEESVMSVETVALVNLEPRTRAVIEELRKFLPPVDNELFLEEAVWRFNDDKNTTTQDVLNIFDKALAEHGAL